MKVRIALLAISVVVFAPGIAVSQTADVCAKIIDHGLNNIAIATSAEAYTDRLYWRFCDEKYDRLSQEKKTEFGLTAKSIPFNFGAGDSSDREKHTKFCGDYRTMTTQNSSEAIYTNKMHDKAIDAWRTCIAITQRQLFIDFETPTNERYTDATIKYTGPSGPIMFNGVEQHEMTCSFDGKPADASTKIELSTSTKTLHCERKVYQQEVGGVQANYYPPAGITIKTDAGNSSYEFVEMIDGPARQKFQQMDSRIAKVNDDARRALDSFSSYLATKWDANEQYIGQTSAIPDQWEDRRCAEGQYAVGVSVSGAGGRYCVGCVAHIRIICRPLPKVTRAPTG